MAVCLFHPRRTVTTLDPDSHREHLKCSNAGTGPSYTKPVSEQRPFDWFTGAAVKQGVLILYLRHCRNCVLSTGKG